MKGAVLPIATVPKAHRRVLAWIEPRAGDGPGADISGWHTITRQDDNWYIGEPSLYDSSLSLELEWIREWRLLPAERNPFELAEEDILAIASNRARSIADHIIMVFGLKIDPGQRLMLRDIIGSDLLHELLSVWRRVNKP